MKYARLLSLCCLLCFSGRLLAEDNVSEWYVGGFITQGLVATDNNNFAGKSSEGVSSDFRELAVYATWRPLSNMHFSGQIMSRPFGNVDDGTPQIDYLLADYSFSVGSYNEFGLRVGRVKLPYGFYNETRDVSFTRPSIVLPQSIYLDVIREIQISADGVMAYGYFPISDLRIDVDLVIGKPREGDQAEYAYLRSNYSGSFTDSNGVMSRVTLGDDAETWRLGITLGRYDLRYKPGSLGELGLSQGDVNFDVAVASGQYNTESWSLAAEYMLVSVDRSDLGGFFELNGNNNSDSYYLQAIYRFNRDWDLLIRRDVFYLDKNDRSGLKAEQLTGLPAYFMWAKDYTIGLGWQASQNISFRAEWHYVQGTVWLPAQDNPDIGSIKKNWNMYLLQATYRF
ncbi:hypothetical protein [Neptunomonas qingdaonensis]|uniref:Phosphate-selective porin O and P n=1 Tax=Neptunomonas qingdaonensis TaxID=1045558 RepID=A0A1I2P0T4_9GAMM|nr:hypothetical protein [Neptunomonas qingdaonensis]SFG07497.1 hypothetical protein SAMN05216175_103129 [Neptunomonas qingdaonensis]